MIIIFSLKGLLYIPWMRYYIILFLHFFFPPVFYILIGLTSFALFIFNANMISKVLLKHVIIFDFFTHTTTSFKVSTNRFIRSVGTTSAAGSLMEAPGPGRNGKHGLLMIGIGLCIGAGCNFIANDVVI